MQWIAPYTVESHVGANDYRIKMGSKTKTYHVNMLKKYIAREPEVDVVHTSNKDDATIAVAGVIYQDTNPELGEVPDLEGYHQKEGVRDVRLGEDLFVAPEDVYKTGFVTPDGQYKFLRIPFGMVNPGATLVQRLKKVLEGLSGVGSYIDDIVIYSDSWEEHLRTLKELFGRLRRARITA